MADFESAELASSKFMQGVKSRARTESGSTEKKATKSEILASVLHSREAIIIDMEDTIELRCTYVGTEPKVMVEVASS